MNEKLIIDDHMSIDYNKLRSINKPILFNKEFDFCTGLQEIDNYNGKWNKRNLIGIIGERGSGKSALAKKIATSNARIGHNVLYLSWDIKNKSIIPYPSMGSLEIDVLKIPDTIGEQEQWILNRIKGHDLIIIDEIGFNSSNIFPIICKSIDLKNYSFLIVSTTNRTIQKNEGGYFTSENVLKFNCNKIFKIKKTEKMYEISIIKSKPIPTEMYFSYDRSVLDKFSQKIEPQQHSWNWNKIQNLINE